MTRDDDLPLVLDLTEVIASLERALDVARELNGTRTKEEDPRKSNPHLARISSELRFLRDLTVAADGAAAVVYWQIKGKGDIRVSKDG